MERQNRLWSRLVSRLRNSRSEYRCNQTGRRRPRHLLRIRHPSLASDAIRSVTPLPQRPSERGLPVTTQFSPFRRNFSSSGGQLYVPKCLSGFNFENLLHGTSTFDDFSRSCWLENRLHMFGGVNRESRTETNFDNFSDDTQSEIENFPPRNANNLNSELIINSADTSSNLGESVSLQGDRLRHLTRDCNMSDSASGSGGTVSDITRFYNSMNLPGVVFNHDTFTAPPPYSEFPEYPSDPPPPYTENFFIRSNRSQSSLSRRASRQLAEQAILW